MGFDGVPWLGRAARWPGGRVLWGVRCMQRSIAERVWSTLVRRSWRLGILGTAGDCCGVR
jgi:hypothetical protein